jgi:hypothetical protein
MPKHVMRLILASILLAVTGLCIFGFLATFEPNVGNAVVWRLGYAIVALGAFLTAVRVAWLAAALLRSK